MFMHRITQRRALFSFIASLATINCHAVKVNSLCSFLKDPKCFNFLKSAQEHGVKLLEKKIGKDKGIVNPVNPEEFHLSLLMVEFLPKHWKYTHSKKINQIVADILKNKKIVLSYRRLAVMPNCLIVEYGANKEFKELRKEIVTAVSHTFPKGVIGFPDEAFPHVTLAYYETSAFNVPYNEHEGRKIMALMRYDNLNGRKDFTINGDQNLDLNVNFWKGDFIKSKM